MFGMQEESWRIEQEPYQRLAQRESAGFSGKTVGYWRVKAARKPIDTSMITARISGVSAARRVLLDTVFHA